MATQITGHFIMNSNQYDTYGHWKSFCLNHGIDFDGLYQNQCVDPLSLLWFQYGLTFSVGGTLYAYNAWLLAKNYNARPPFVAIDDITQIKRGDAVVFRGDSWSSYGHVAFADGNYWQAYRDQDGILRLPCLGQNQGQGIAWGTPSIVANLNINQALGAFRNTNWNSAPPTPPSPTTIKKRSEKPFPWAIYANKLRNARKLL